jgi:hypothetical protein
MTTDVHEAIQLASSALKVSVRVRVRVREDIQLASSALKVSIRVSVRLKVRFRFM